MKRAIAVSLITVMFVSLVACGEEKKEERTSDAENMLAEAASEPESNEDTSETATENEQTDEESESEPVNESEAEEMKILVAYFSATNTTKGVAETIADSLYADIYEIVPEQPYTDADLNYHDDNSRSTIEMNDSSARPAISVSVEDMEQYDIVFIGYPIWLAYHNLIQCT